MGEWGLGASDDEEQTITQTGPWHHSMGTEIYHVLALQPRANHLATISLNFLICIMGVMRATSPHCVVVNTAMIHDKQ